jgi:hypothetical protein
MARRLAGIPVASANAVNFWGYAVIKTVIGLFEDSDDAQGAVRGLLDAGFDRDEISLIGHADHETAGAAERASDIAVGAGAGAALGGLGGLLLGVGALAIPGIGPVLAVGPIATALAGAGIGAAAGGVIGALSDLGVPEDEARYYAEGLRRGGVLVALRGDDAAIDQAVAIMDRHGAVDIDERVERWQRGGWPGFDQVAEPYPMADLIRERELNRDERAQRDAGTPRRRVRVYERRPAA